MTFAAGTTSLPTPALLLDAEALDHNIAAMAAVLPGRRLRPHVKAFKSTALAQRLADVGHDTFTVATLREAAGLIKAGLGEDVLLANESVDVSLLRSVVELDGNLTVAVDSAETIAAAAAAGVAAVLIDVNVGLPRCGCDPDIAGELADQAAAAGLRVRGVMGYEGHLMMVPDPASKARKVERSMALLLAASQAVLANHPHATIVSAGGTGTFDTNTWANEIQAGSYLMMDTHYGTLEQPFRQALWVESTVISIAPDRSYIVGDAGLKAFGMDHGDPSWGEGEVLFCSDEHITMRPADPDAWTVGDRVRLVPGHVDPTIAKHERMWLIEDGTEPVALEVDLRNW
jgi:D-serine deaminase-like pyridoxal phosphate-dependent protein